MSSLPVWKKHASGLETLLVEKHDRPIVKMNFVFPFGSYEDPKGKEGLINFVGDMLLRGSKNKSREEIEFTLDHLGAALNVFIGYHSLVIEARVLTKNLPSFMKFLKDVVTTPAFDADEIQKLKNEIKSDLMMRLEDDQDLAKYHFSKEIYANHLYSRDVMGTSKSLDSITVDDIQASYKKFLNKNGMLIGAAGALTPAEFEKYAVEFYELFPESSIKPTLAPFSSTIKGKEITLVDKPDLTQTQFYIGHPSIGITHDDLIPLDVFMTSFAGSMFQAKYMQEIRVKRGWSYGAYGSMDARRDGGAVYLHTFTKTDDTVDAIELSIQLFEQAVEGSLLDAGSIDFAKNYLTRSFPFKIDTPEKILAIKLFNKLSGRSENEIETYRKKVQETDYNSILKKVQQHFTPQNVKIVVTCTASLLDEKLKARIAPTKFTVKKYNSID
jgi:zinc protease